MQIATLAAFGLEAVNMVVAPRFAELYTRGHIERLQQLVTISARVVLAFNVMITGFFVLAGRFFLTLVFWGRVCRFLCLPVDSAGWATGQFCGRLSGIPYKHDWPRTRDGAQYGLGGGNQHSPGATVDSPLGYPGCHRRYGNFYDGVEGPALVARAPATGYQQFSFYHLERTYERVNTMRLPNFFIIGVSKCGTTLLAKYPNSEKSDLYPRIGKLK